MKISTARNSDGTFSISFDGTTVDLTAQDLKLLLLNVTQILAPGSGAAKDASARTQRFLGRIREASDVDLQVFIHAADHDDIVVLSKATEDDSDVRQKLFRNMSENSRKMVVEDMEFRFRDTVPDSEIAGTFERLGRTADALRVEGRTDL